MSAEIKITLLTERVRLVVSPGFLDLTPGEVEVDVCLICGALIFGREKHIKWHEEKEK